MKRYFLPLLLATACVGGCASKGWGMMGKEDSEKDSSDQNQKLKLSKSMMNSALFLNQITKPKKQQYPLEGEELQRAVNFLKQKPALYNPQISITEEEKKTISKMDLFVAMNDLSEEIGNLDTLPQTPQTVSKLENLLKNPPPHKSLEDLCDAIEKTNNKLVDYTRFVHKNERSRSYNGSNGVGERAVLKYEDCLPFWQNERREAFLVLFSILGTNFETWDKDSINSMKWACEAFLYPAPKDPIYSHLLTKKQEQFASYLKLLEIRTDLYKASLLFNSPIEFLKEEVFLELYTDFIKAGAPLKALKCLLLKGIPLTEKTFKNLEPFLNMQNNDFIPLFYQLLQYPGLIPLTLQYLKKNPLGLPEAIEGGDKIFKYFATLLHKETLQDIKTFFLRKPIKKLQADPQTLHMMASIVEKIAKGDVDLRKASKLYEYLMEVGHPDAAIRYGIVRLQSEELWKNIKEFNEVLQILEKALKEKEDLEGYFALGKGYLKLGKIEEAYSHLEKSIERGHKPAFEYMEAVHALRDQSKKGEEGNTTPPQEEKPVEKIKNIISSPEIKPEESKENEKLTQKNTIPSAPQSTKKKNPLKEKDIFIKPLPKGQQKEEGGINLWSLIPEKNTADDDAQTVVTTLTKGTINTNMDEKRKDAQELLSEIFYRYLNDPTQAIKDPKAEPKAVEILKKLGEIDQKKTFERVSQAQLDLDQLVNKLKDLAKESVNEAPKNSKHNKNELSRREWSQIIDDMENLALDIKVLVSKNPELGTGPDKKPPFEMVKEEGGHNCLKYKLINNQNERYAMVTKDQTHGLTFKTLNPTLKGDWKESLINIGLLSEEKKI